VKSGMKKTPFLKRERENTLSGILRRKRTKLRSIKIFLIICLKRKERILLKVLKRGKRRMAVKLEKEGNCLIVLKREKMLRLNKMTPTGMNLRTMAVKHFSKKNPTLNSVEKTWRPGKGIIQERRRRMHQRRTRRKNQKWRSTKKNPR